MDNLLYQSTVELVEAIRNKEISAEELVLAHIRRIEEVNSQLNAVVQMAAEAALKQARVADEKLARGESSGALHGIPMTIKDSLDTAGVISTGGTLGRRAFIPAKDATVVARLKDEGAILLGKSNTPELTLNFETYNLVYGRTNNPYDLTRSSGGSSGGAAAIVASGGSPFDIGSDYAGSIRLPAHFCGVAGIKPTSGRVPRSGHIIPYAAGAADSFQQIGPLARTVDDLILLLPIIAGVDWQDPAIVPMPLGDPSEVDLGSLRVAFFTDNGTVTPTAEIVRAVSDVAKAVESEGATVNEDRPERLEESLKLWRDIHLADNRQGVLNILAQAGTEQTSDYMQAAPEDGKASSEEFGRRLRELDIFRSQMLSFMSNYDVIICPVNANAAIKHGTLQEHREGFSYTATFNLTGWPGVVVRVGTSPEGLPIGVQIVARPWREDVALAVARFVERSFGGWQPPPL